MIKITSDENVVQGKIQGSLPVILTDLTRIIHVVDSRFEGENQIMFRFALTRALLDGVVFCISPEKMAELLYEVGESYKAEGNREKNAQQHDLAEVLAELQKLSEDMP